MFENILMFWCPFVWGVLGMLMSPRDDGFDNPSLIYNYLPLDLCIPKLMVLAIGFALTLYPSDGYHGGRVCFLFRSLDLLTCGVNKVKRYALF